MRKFVLLSCLLGLSLLGGGCYRVGNIGHPQIKTIAVAPVVNETLAYNMAARVRGLLCERFTTDGTLKLVSESKADCILYAKVTQVAFSEVSWASQTTRTDGKNLFTPNQWKVTLTIQYSVIIPGRGEPLISSRTATGSAEFETGADMEIGRDYGIRQAAYQASKNVVAGITEGW